MKSISRTTLLLTLFALVLPAAALDLSDLMNPDDVMLRRPAKKTQPATRRPAMPPTKAPLSPTVIPTFSTRQFVISSESAQAPAIPPRP